eukprot:TRINITY_DN50561_c0_g1_i1.p3 TRINITY_DN50561_c0_g1~~TRINITY_DN50561_c0_g1_i1.p3  ORF type:complete len:115 (+),score=0.43 TRINITY_DN50561_c0_g1_i1:3-347(+)
MEGRCFRRGRSAPSQPGITCPRHTTSGRQPGPVHDHLPAALRDAGPCDAPCQCVAGEGGPAPSLHSPSAAAPPLPTHHTLADELELVGVLGKGEQGEAPALGGSSAPGERDCTS